MTVSVIDLTTDAIVATIDVGIQLAGLAITPDGRYVYVSNYNTLYAGPMFTNLTPGQGTVNVIDTATSTVLSPTISVDQSPNGIGITPNGFYAYVTNFISNTVNVIAVQTLGRRFESCPGSQSSLIRAFRLGKLRLVCQFL